MDASLNKLEKGRYYKKIKLFTEQHTKYSLILSVLIFIVIIIGASLYANALVYDYFTVKGQPTGLGTHISFTATFDRYDTHHYLNIAQFGYKNKTDAAFLPIYPLAIRAIERVTHISYLLAGFLVSWVALCGVIILVYKWLKLELDKRKIKLSPWTVLGIIAIFPTSFYFVLPYTESLFMLFNIGAIYAYRKDKYLTATILAALASATRYQGLVLGIFFLADYLFTKKDRNWKKLIPILGVACGFIIYMIFLKLHYGSPFEFITAEKSWNRLSGNYVKNLILTFRPIYVWYLAVLITALISTWKYLGKAYFFYCLIFILLPFSSGSFASFNRYMLILLPMLLALTIYGKNKFSHQAQLLYISSSVFLLAWSVLLFANGYWVA